MRRNPIRIAVYTCNLGGAVVELYRHGDSFEVAASQTKQRAALCREAARKLRRLADELDLTANRPAAK